MPTRLSKTRKQYVTTLAEVVCSLQTYQSRQTKITIANYDAVEVTFPLAMGVLESIANILVEEGTAEISLKTTISHIAYSLFSMAGGQHHHRTNLDKYHPGYFGKVSKIF